MDALLPDILSAVSAQKGSKQWVESGGKYIPNPATWLHGQRWLDETPEVSSGECMPDNIEDRAMEALGF